MYMGYKPVVKKEMLQNIEHVPKYMQNILDKSLNLAKNVLIQCPN